MKKRIFRFMFTFICLFFVFLSFSVPLSALSLDDYNPDVIELGTVLTVNDQNELYTPFIFSVFGKKGINSPSSYNDLNYIYRFGVSHLMDPSDFRYSDGLSVTFRANAENNVYIPVTYEVTNSAYTAASIRNPGSQYLTLTGSMGSVQDYIASEYVMIQSSGYALRTSNMTSSVNGVGSLRLNDVDIGYVEVKYDYSIIGLETTRVFKGSDIETRDFQNHSGSVPFLPYNVLAQFFQYEDCYVEYCDVTVEFFNGSGNTFEYTGNYQFYLLGGDVYDVFSDIDPLTSILKNVDYATGYEEGYRQGEWYGRSISVTDAYQEGYDAGRDDGLDEGYNEGVAVAYEDLSPVNFLGVAVGGFLDAEIFGNFSIGGLLNVVIALGLVMAFLKFFAGG